MAKKSTPRTSKRPKVVLEFSVLDDETKKRIATCIERRGKVTVTMTHVAKAGLRNGDGGFAQKVD